MDMFYCINSIEDDIGIPPTISKNSPIFASIDLSHNAKSVAVDSFDPDFSYNKSHASLSWPVVKDLLPADTLHRIESIYRKDIDSLIKRRY
jgi:hypothetical protein